MTLVLTPAHRELVYNLIARDVKTRYKQSSLGYIWAVVNPLAFALIYTAVGQHIMKARVSAIDFTVYSYFGLLFWNLFASGLTAATESLVAHIGLITKVYFPREVFPIAAVASKLVDFGFGFVGLFLLLPFNRHSHLSWSHLPMVVPMLAILLLYTAGLGMLMACLNLFYRDFRHLVGIGLALGSFLVPNIYSLGQVPLAWQPLYLANPVAALTEAARRIAFPETGWLRWVWADASNPTQQNLTSLWVYIGAAAATSLAVFVIGYIVFKRHEPRFAEFI